MLRRPRQGRLAAAVLAAGLGALALTGCGGGAEAASPAPAPPAVSATADPSAPVAVLPAVLAASRPVRVQIPSIGVDVELMDLGVQADGRLEVPPTGFPAGWFTGAPTPGERGPAVIAGHVDWGGSPGVFYALRHVVVGDEIDVDRKTAAPLSSASPRSGSSRRTPSRPRLSTATSTTRACGSSPAAATSTTPRTATWTTPWSSPTWSPTADGSARRPAGRTGA